MLAIPTRQKVKKRRAAMKELKQRCSAAVHKQESLVRFTKTNDQKREENLNELKLRLNRQPKISDLFLTYENNESCETRRHESCYSSAAAFMLAHSHINLQHQFAYKLIEDNNKREMIYARFFPPFFAASREASSSHSITLLLPYPSHPIISDDALIFFQRSH